MEQEATLYRQISRQLLQDIYKGTYPYGTKLLQALGSSSRKKIRAALALLEKDGALQREKGSCARVSRIYIISRRIGIFCIMACSRDGVAHV
ncbi:MAG: GntR family transcriptional regulator [Clostridium sp.]